MRVSRFGGVMLAVLLAANSATARAAAPSSELDATNSVDLSAFSLAIPMADHGDLAAAESTDTSRSGRFDPKALLDADAAYLNGPRGARRSATSDGTYTYRLNYRTGDVIRYDRMWDNPYPIFSVADELPGAAWITMNPADGSFWLSQWGQADLVAHFSPTGKLLSSFNSGVFSSVGLVFNPADGTLWTADKDRGLYQFNQSGDLLWSSLSFTSYSDIFGIGSSSFADGQYLFAPVPEPSGLTLAAIGLLSLSAWRWRRAGSRRR